jgi:hypothetical protein
MQAIQVYNNRLKARHRRKVSRTKLAQDYQSFLKYLLYQSLT